MATVEIPPTIRKRVYFGLSVTGLAIGSTSVAYATAEAGQPVWLKVVAAVFAFVSSGVGYVAGTNTDTSDDQ